MKSYLFCFLLLFITLGCSNPQSDSDQFSFPVQLEVIKPLPNSISPCLDCEKKLVIYLDIAERSLYLFSKNISDWVGFSKNHPDVSVICFLSGKSRDGNLSNAKIKEVLASYDFPYGVFLDPDYQFYKTNKLENLPYENKTVQAYLVKGNQVLAEAQIGMPAKLTEDIEGFFGKE